MSNNLPDKTDVVEIYKGKKIRRCNQVQLYFGPATYKAIIDAAEETGLSIHKVLAYSSQPCERCKGLMVVIFDDSGLPKYVKRGILKVPHQNSGRNTFSNKSKGVKVKDEATGEKYESIRQVSNKFNIPYPTLCAKLNGSLENNTTFRYAESD